MKLPLFIASTALTSAVLAADAADWRSRSIYQLLTDRFARRDGSTTAACVTEDRRYCGGTFQGIINQLDYIQGMGFTAVSLSHPRSQTKEHADGRNRYGYPPLLIN